MLEREQAEGPLHASEMTRVEVLAGMRPTEEVVTLALLGTLTWHPVDVDVAVDAGALGRAWLPSHRSIDGADLVVAATALRANARLLTCNIKHFPMFTELAAPY